MSGTGHSEAQMLSISWAETLIAELCFLCNHISIVAIAVRSADNGCRIFFLVSVLQVPWRPGLALLCGVIVSSAKASSWRTVGLLS